MNALKNEEVVVSIIIPVYNAENTLHSCLESLSSQTYPFLQCIFVNDCSQDGSLSKLENFASQYSEHLTMTVDIVNHEVNKGVADARNTGLATASGKYIYYLDADDRLDARAIDLMVKRAGLNDSDVIGINWFLSFEENERKMNQPNFETSLEALQMMMTGKMRWNLWLFLVKREVYVQNNIRFISGMNMGEDMLVMFKVFLNASKVGFLDEALYHYGQSNSESLTKTYSERHIEEVSYNVGLLEKEVLNSIYKVELEKYIDYLKLNIKLPLLISNSAEQYSKWKIWFSEANTKVLEIPDISFRNKILQWMVLNNQFWFAKLYYKLVIRFLYGIVYK